uniref:Uncharacterized protein n=1 Tax=Romanomermis culicivorax TaxID=13658 RepID=A0A915I608_ROMCU
MSTHNFDNKRPLMTLGCGRNGVNLLMRTFKNRHGTTVASDTYQICYFVEDQIFASQQTAFPFAEGLASCAADYRATTLYDVRGKVPVHFLNRIASKKHDKFTLISFSNDKHLASHVDAHANDGSYGGIHTWENDKAITALITNLRIPSSLIMLLY